MGGGWLGFGDSGARLSFGRNAWLIALTEGRGGLFVGGHKARVVTRAQRPELVQLLGQKKCRGP